MGTGNANSNAAGAVSAMAAMFFFSLNDVFIKFLSDAYPLHEVVLARSVIGMVAFLIFILPFTGGVKTLRTRRLEMHLLRGGCVVFAKTCFSWVWHLCLWLTLSLFCQPLVDHDCFCFFLT